MLSNVILYLRIIKKGEYDIKYHARKNEHKKVFNFSDDNYYDINHNFKYIYK